MLGARTAVSMLAGLALALCAAPALAATPVEAHGALRVEHGRLVDAHGQPVTLRGMSLFWSQWKGQYYNAGAIRWLRDDWKADVVRVAVGVEPDGYLAHPREEMRKAQAAIDGAIAAGLYVIVDWHAHHPHPKEAAAFFETIARKYGDRPNLIYETWNEPLPQYGWSAAVRPYHVEVIDRIRAIDPDNLVVAGTPSWSQDVDIAAADPLPYANLAYTMHFYAGTHRQELRDKTRKALDLGACIFVTEWGTAAADGDGGLDAAETHRWWDFLESNGLSHLNWSVTDKVETTAALKPGAAATGGWPDDMLTPSGRMVRGRLRQMAGH